MDRKEFLKMFGVGAAVAFVPASAKGREDEKIVTKEEGKDFEALYKMFHERKPINIHGFEFQLQEVTHNYERLGYNSIDLHLTSYFDGD